FSSRRRHTRFSRDWSSDVCSSDLAAAGAIDSIFRPLPLLRPAQEAALRAFPNARQLSRARELGVGRDLPPGRLADLESEGELVQIGRETCRERGKNVHGRDFYI